MSRERGFIQLILIIAVVGLIVLGYISFEVDVNWTNLFNDIRDVGIGGLISAFWDVVVNFWNTWIAEPFVRLMHAITDGSFPGLRENQVDRTTLPLEN